MEERLRLERLHWEKKNIDPHQVPAVAFLADEAQRAILDVENAERAEMERLRRGQNAQQG